MSTNTTPDPRTAVEAHAAACREAWGLGEQRPVYDGPSLVGADLGSANLDDANLRGADLRGIDLGCANLFSADLRGAVLHEATLTCADLRGTDLRDANLSGAYMTCADMRGTVLRGAVLSGAYLCGANLSADLREANLSGTNLASANLHRSIGIVYAAANCSDHDGGFLMNVWMGGENRDRMMLGCGCLCCDISEGMERFEAHIANKADAKVCRDVAKFCVEQVKRQLAAGHMDH